MIRKATTEDITAIQEMAEVVFRKTYADILSPEQMEYMMNMMYSEQSLLAQMTSGKNIFFIEDGNGYASYRYQGRSDSGRDIFHLEKLYVMPAAQKSGLGKKLFEAIVDDIKVSSGGSPVIELNVNRRNPAVGFYEHIGMQKERQGDFPIGNGYYMNDFIMSMEL